MAGTFLRHSIVNAVAGAFMTLGGFAGSVIVARLLGVQGTGVVAYAVWAVTVAIIVADVGIPGTLSRFLPEIRARDGEAAAGGLTRMMWRPFLASTALLGALFLGYAALQAHMNPHLDPWSIGPDTFRSSPLFWGLVAFSCVAQSLGCFAGGWLQGMQRFGDYARLAFLGSLVQIAGTAAGAVLFGAAGALAGAAIGALVPTWALLSARTDGPSIEADLRRRVLRYTLETWGGYIVVSFFASRMEVFFLERSWGSHAVGLFTVSLTLSNLATQGPLLLTGALLPHLAQRLGRGEGDAARALYPTSLRLMALLVFPACFGAAAIAPVLLPTIYGAAFAQAIPSATILVAGAAIATCTSVAGTYNAAAERTRFGLVMGLAGAVASVAAGLTLIPVFGAVGAACGRVAIQVTIAAATLVYVHRNLGCRVPVSDLIRLAIAAMCCAVVARGIIAWEPNIPGLAAAIGVGALNYVLALRVLAPLPARDIERLVSSFAILPARLRPAAAAGLLFIAGA